MNRKRIISILDKNFRKWIKSIDDEETRKLAENNSFITGGAFVSLFDGEEPNDFDIYFLNYETALAVARHYVDRWNKYDHKKKASLVIDEEKRIKVRVQSSGIAYDENVTEDDFRAGLNLPSKESKESKKKDEKPYRPVFLSDNAITLSDRIQLIIRFYGEPEEVHKNFDFVHCTNYYIPSQRKLVLPAQALESYIFKELKYVGSRYPIASIIRTRKFIKRGFKVNAGQYLKMVFQLEQFDLTDPLVLVDQLNGVDLLYMSSIVDAISNAKVNDPGLNIDASYLVEVVEKIFDEDHNYDSRLDEEEPDQDNEGEE